MMDRQLSSQKFIISMVMARAASRTLFIVSCLTLANPAFAADSVQILGDASLLPQLLAGIDASYNQYPRGRMAYRVQVASREADAWDDLRIVFTWSGDLRSWVISGQSFSKNIKNRDLPEGLLIERKGKHVVYARRRVYSYNPVAGGGRGALADNPRPLEGRWPLECLAHPQDHWFSYRPQGRTWSEYLDAARIGKYVASIEVKQMDHRVHISRISHSGAHAEITFSMDHGGNVTKCVRHPVPRSGKEVVITEYEWVKHDEGLWRLGRLAVWTKPEVSTDGPERRYQFDIESFDPDPKFSDGHFTLAGMNVKKGAVVSRRDITLD
ncbi:hypothetical protein [Fuerstiella marisgermanici]|uniref:Outer membrane lipoprotein-sorting protein n=1 Tax=Fuerstiella marisgermanici TaxID=1891926 RepID=A0A1P8WC22_9PLAN|nr:hypothetical protein [Fuerstiella marisgermanici]APZ91610.1 hypothetical protein Fuma_01199 [Fuerstiella marisgermanici]